MADLKAKISEKDEEIVDPKASVNSLEDRVAEQDNNIIKKDKEIMQISKALQTKQPEKKNA